MNSKNTSNRNMNIKNANYIHTPNVVLESDNELFLQNQRSSISNNQNNNEFLSNPNNNNNSEDENEITHKYNEYLSLKHSMNQKLSTEEHNQNNQRLSIVESNLKGDFKRKFII